ncbi:MAG: hypothetical protein ACO1N3_02805 [Gammaproteobacteria bacterium]
MPKRLIDEYKQRIEKYSLENLKSINSRSPMGFRSFFKLMSSLARPTALKLLSTEQLKELREHIKNRITLLSQSQKDPDTPTKNKGIDTHNTDDHPTDKEDVHEIVSLPIQIERQSAEAYAQLSILEENCNSLRTDSIEAEDLVTELQDFIETANNIIEDASAEAELSFPGVDEERLANLQQITDRIKANNKMILPILKAEKDLPQALKASQEYSSDFSVSTDKDSGEDDSSEEIHIIKRL